MRCHLWSPGITTGLALLTLLAAVPRRPAAAQPAASTAAAPATMDEGARVLLEAMSRAYQALSAYAGSVEVQSGAGPEARRLQASLLIRKPDRAALSAAQPRGPSRVVTDGARLFVLSPGPQAGAAEHPLPSGVSAIEAVLHEGGLPDCTLGLLLSGRDLLVAHPGALKALWPGGRGMRGGVPVEKVVAVWQSEQGEETVCYAVGTRDHLLRQVTFTRTVDGRQVSRTETYADVRADPDLPEATFQMPLPVPVPSQPRATVPAQTAAAVPPIIPAPARPAPPAASGRERNAEPSLESPVMLRHDFGAVSPLDLSRLEHTFQLQNSGSTPLQIRRLQPSCGCLSTFVGPTGSETSSTTRLPCLAPGEETAVRVAVNVASLRPGPIHKSVTVYAEGRTEPVAYCGIVGTLSAAVTFSPPRIDFGRVTSGATPSVTLKMTLDARLTTSGSLPRLVCSNPAVHICVVSEDAPWERSGEHPPVRAYTYTISLAPDALPGSVSGAIRFDLAATGSTLPAAGLQPGGIPSVLQSAAVPVSGWVVEAPAVAVGGNGR